MSRRLQLIVIFGGMAALVAPMMARLAYSWAGPHLGAPLLVFDSQDPKLFLLIGIILITPGHVGILPPAFRAEPQTDTP